MKNFKTTSKLKAIDYAAKVAFNEAEFAVLHEDLNMQQWKGKEMFEVKVELIKGKEIQGI